MKLTLYIVGGLLLWLGGYGYLKTRNSLGMRPLPGSAASTAYAICGGAAQLLSIPYLVTMAMVFEWWIALLFFVFGSLATGILYSKLVAGGAGLPLIGVPLGIVLAAIGLAI